MLTTADAKARNSTRIGLADLPPVQSDSLLALIAMCNADPRPEKIDVGVGVFRDGQGRTPILKVMKQAERILTETQESKSYLGSARGQALCRVVAADPARGACDDERIAGVRLRAAAVHCGWASN
jgi:aromatic-amino-acid transaminase